MMCAINKLCSLTFIFLAGIVGPANSSEIRSERNKSILYFVGQRSVVEMKGRVFKSGELVSKIKADQGEYRLKGYGDVLLKVLPCASVKIYGSGVFEINYSDRYLLSLKSGSAIIRACKTQSPFWVKLKKGSIEIGDGFYWITANKEKIDIVIE